MGLLNKRRRVKRRKQRLDYLRRKNARIALPRSRKWPYVPVIEIKPRPEAMAPPPPTIKSFPKALKNIVKNSWKKIMRFR